MLATLSFHSLLMTPWGGNSPMGRFEETVKPQNKAIFVYRPMRVLPPHGMFAAPWANYRPMGSTTT